MKASKIALSLALAAAIITTDWAILHRDWIPLLWHLKHGRHIESNGIQFAVPLLYQEDHRTSVNTLVFYQFPGHFSRKTAAITVQFNTTRPAPSRGDSFRKEERSANLAGKQGQCVEYVERKMRHISIDNIQLAYPASDAATYIYCNFNPEISISFSGDFDAKNDFYAFMAEAELLDK